VIKAHAEVRTKTIRAAKDRDVCRRLSSEGQSRPLLFSDRHATQQNSCGPQDGCRSRADAAFWLDGRAAARRAAPSDV